MWSLRDGVHEIERFGRLVPHAVRVTMAGLAVPGEDARPVFNLEGVAVSTTAWQTPSPMYLSPIPRSLRANVFAHR